MKKKTNIHFIIFQSVPYAIALTTGFFLSLNSHAITCKNLFPSNKSTQVKKIIANSASKKSAAASIVLQPDQFQIVDFTQIERGNQQFPGSKYLNSIQVGNYHFYQDYLGDQFTIEIFPQGTPLHLANIYRSEEQEKQHVQLAHNRNDTRPISNSSRSHQVTLANSGHRTSLQTSTRNVITRSETQLGASEKETLLTEFISDTYNGQLSEGSLRTLVATLKDDRETIANAIAYRSKKNQFIKEANESTSSHLSAQTQIKGIVLTNFNSNKFFWFIPQGQSQYYPARVLDIHNDPYRGIIILVEFIVDNGAVDSLRSRNIVEISSSELASIQVDGQFSRQKSEKSFLESLSSVELQTIKLARNYSLKLFGYSDFRRNPGKTAQDAPTLLETINLISPKAAMFQQISRRWTNIRDYYTESEQQKPDLEVHIIDIFARMRPDFVVKNFKDTNFEYTWVITEDGQLKITPKGELNINLKPQLLRLAAGRRVYAGGDFTFNHDGTIAVTLESNNYQNVNTNWGRSQSFAPSSHLNSFIQAAFATQAKVMTNSIDSIPTQSYSSTFANKSTKSQKNSETQWGQAGRDHRFSKENAENDFFNFIDDIFTKSGLNKDKSEIDIQWNVETEKPLDFASWKKASKITDSFYDQKSLRIRWAHYILNTDPNTALDTIKKAGRKLRSIFHPDRNKQENAHQTVQLINEAISILEQ